MPFLKLLNKLPTRLDDAESKTMFIEKKKSGEGNENVNHGRVTRRTCVLSSEYVLDGDKFIRWEGKTCVCTCCV